MEMVASVYKRTRTSTVPKLSELLDRKPEPMEAPEIVLRKLGQYTLAAGLDLETNDFVKGRKPSCVGRFGHKCWCGPEDLQFRLVQVGWVLGGCTKGEPIHTRKERLIEPQNFNISEDATNKHGITNADIKTNGLPLREVLEELMSAMWALHGAGGVVVSHHLEFDAGIIDEELQRCEMEEWRPRWKLIASNGICTLDLNVQEWFQTTSGRVKEPGEKTLVMNLRDSVMLFYADCPPVLELLKRTHTAGADAELHLLLYRALRDLATRHA